MMLANQDSRPGAKRFYALLNPLIGVQLLWVEDSRFLCAGSAFAPGERVHAKMEKSLHLATLPRQLAGMWNN
jgi:hypothetical protein